MTATAVPPVVEAFVDAARRHELERMRSLVDWELSGIARVLRALGGVDEQDRDRVVGSGLEEMRQANSERELTEGVLSAMASRLEGTLGTRAAGAAESKQVLATLHPPEIPRGLTAERQAAATEVATRAQAIQLVFIAEGPTRIVPLAVSLGGDAVVLPLEL